MLRQEHVNETGLEVATNALATAVCCGRSADVPATLRAFGVSHDARRAALRCAALLRPYAQLALHTTASDCFSCCDQGSLPSQTASSSPTATGHFAIGMRSFRARDFGETAGLFGSEGSVSDAPPPPPPPLQF